MNNSELTTFNVQDEPLLEPTQPVGESCDEEKAIAPAEAAEPMILSPCLETIDETLNEELEANSSEDEENNDCSLTFSPTRIFDNSENYLLNEAFPRAKAELPEVQEDLQQQ